MKGRRKFARAEVGEIRALLVEIRQGGRKVQMRLRRRLRNEFDFHILDFDQSRSGFTPNDLDMLVSSGAIEIDG